MFLMQVTSILREVKEYSESETIIGLGMNECST